MAPSEVLLAIEGSLVVGYHTLAVVAAGALAASVALSEVLLAI